MSRDPIKVVRDRASKSQALREFLDNIENHSIDDVESLNVKRSDKKLLRTHFDRLKSHCRAENLLGHLQAAIEKMPKSSGEKEIFDVLIYDGPGDEYDGLEITPGTVVTESSDWIRFDFYRLKKKEDTTRIVSHCSKVGEMDTAEANRYIQDKINGRYSGSSLDQSRGDQSRGELFRISRL